MDFEKALEFAVISSWEDLVKPRDNSSIHVEYTNVDGIPVASLEVWAMYKGHGNRVCDYSLSSPSGLRPQGKHFAGSCASQTLTEALDFIMLNQRRFDRPRGRGVSGLVQVATPTTEDRARAAEWWHHICTKIVRSAPPADAQPKLRLGSFTESKVQTN